MLLYYLLSTLAKIEGKAVYKVLRNGNIVDLNRSMQTCFILHSVVKQDVLL